MWWSWQGGRAGCGSLRRRSEDFRAKSRGTEGRSLHQAILRLRDGNSIPSTTPTPYDSPGRGACMGRGLGFQVALHWRWGHHSLWPPD